MNKKAQPLRRLLLKNYFTLFLLILIIIICSSWIVLMIASRIESYAVESNFNANAYLKDHVNDINAPDLIAYGGGLEVITKDLEVIKVQGKSQLSTGPISESVFGEYFYEMKNPEDDLKFDVAYHETKEYWLVIHYPVDFEFRVFINKSKDLRAKDLNRVSLFILVTFMIYFFSFMLGLVLYSKVTAKSFVNPLNKMIHLFKKVINKETYKPAVIYETEEFVTLNNLFNQMIDEIDQEKQRRKKSEENRRRLVLDISHDLKNPLNTILGYSELILEQSTSQETKNYASVIQSNALRANQLLMDLFEYSKLNSEDYEPVLKDIDFTEWLRQYFIEKIAMIELNDFRYDLSIPEQQIKVAIDMKLLKRGLDNIINNTLKYNPKETTIQISLILKDENIELFIKDDGVGIEPEVQKNLFKPFYGTHHHEEGASGLGLAITKRIINLHHGHIEYDQSITKGTGFIIKLPIK